MHTVGVIYGQVGSTRFDVAVHDGGLRRLDYVAVEHDGHRVLGQVQDVVRKSRLSYDEAMRLQERGHDVGDDQLSAAVHVIGFKDKNNRVQTPRTPFQAGLDVERAEDSLVTSILGLQASAADGAHLGSVKGSRIPVSLSMNTLAQKHVSVLAKTGAGKSYTVGVILEEFLKAEVPLVILDPHGEYGSLRHANVEEREVAVMRRFGIKPRSFQKQIREFAIDTRINPDADRLVLEGMNLEGREIVDLLGGQISGGQVGVLYQAVKEVKDHLPAYTLKDVADAVSRNKSSAKWNVLNALESLEATRVFDIRGTPVGELVQPGSCTIINLKGVAPDIQEIVVTRITNLLWQARKRNEVAPHILVCEEAHNFCPERGVGNAISGPILRTVASEGRKFGMGLVIVSQRPAKIDKNVLSQCNTQVVLKVTNPNDLKAIVASVEGITSETADEVQRLPIGSALVAGGGLTQPVFVDVRPRHTRHGGQSIEIVQNKAPAPLQVEKPPAEQDEAPIAAPPMRRHAVQAPDDDPSGAEEPSEEPLIPTAHARDDGVVTEPQRHPEPLTRPRRARAAHVHNNPPPKPHTFTVTRSSAKEAGKVRDNRAAGREPTWNGKDAEHIHRVAHRVGLVTEGRPPEDTIQRLTGLAHSNGRDPHQRLRLYQEIGQTICLDDAPSCIRCPLKDPCQHHQQLQAERHKSRSVIRRLWGN